MRPLIGVQICVVDAQTQARTPRTVVGPWVRPRAPSKRAGRVGTRKAWKRRRENQPHFVMFYEEPTDVLMSGTLAIVTPRQLQEIKRAAKDRPGAPHGPPSSIWSGL